MKFITAQELKQWIDNNEPIQLIDTRTTDKYETCHIPGAISIPQLDIPMMLGLIDTNSKVVIYCIYGIKSEQVFIYLKDKLKIKELFILDGGIYKYATEIDPTMDV
ncbi:MAG: rhodanese-like domain-containing protein [Lentimicrobium sp.]|jgi:adenylyltransferase/sulfurtransferase|nr:rhodanese-like domain-containing protein [Lentimicrobium sp.]